MNPPDRNTQNSEAGRFQALNLHAQGGIGSVFLARDEQLNRLVALKEIQPDFADDQNSRDRFLREAEVTALLEHPGIVPIYGSGRYPDGRPYYAMRMIQGKSLREAIVDLHRLRATDPHAYEMELRRLLNRFITVCNTIEYANSRAILHRDLKPENIMLGPYGETLVVDWGLAKVLDAQAATPAGDGNVPRDNSPLGIATPKPGTATQAGTIVGTPAYMSPEQALGWHDALTAASDVYSLGATLYTLLTGSVPDVGRDISTILIRIQTQKFPRPRELNPSIALPLEAVCLKAMAPSTKYRYQSAAALATDLEAYLADEPVSAWSEPARVRVARWMRRHRTLVVSAFGVGVVLLIALAAIVVQQKLANEKLAIARDKQKENFDMAREAVDRYFTQVSEDPRLAAQGLEHLRRDLLATAGDFYERFIGDESASADIPYELGWAKFRLASITEEVRSAQEAAAQLEQAAEFFRRLHFSDLSNVAYNEGLLFCQLNLSSLYDRLGNRTQGELMLASATAIAETLVSEEPQNAAYQNVLARCTAMLARRFVEDGDLLSAETSYQKELQVRETLVQLEPGHAGHREELATAHRNLAVLDQRRDRLDAARGQLRTASDIGHKLVSENPDDGALSDSLARTMTFLGDLNARSGQPDAARRDYDEAIALRAKLVERHPDVLEYRAALANTSNNLGSFLYDRGDVKAAETSFANALTNSERLAGDYPQQPRLQKMLAGALLNSATLFAATERLTIAEPYLTRAQELRSKLKQAFPLDEEHEAALAGIQRERAGIESKTGRLKQAEEHYRAAIDALSTLLGKHPEIPRYAALRSGCQRELGDVLKKAQRYDDAFAAYREAEKQQSELVKAHPAVVAYRNSLATTAVQLGSLLLDRQKPDEAIESFRAAIASFADRKESELGRDSRAVLRNAHAGRALVLAQSHNSEEAIADLERAIALGTRDDTVGLRLKRASLLSAVGKADAAATEADGLVQEAVGYGPALFELAKIYAAAANSEKAGSAAAEKHVERAVDLLKQADSAGYFTDPTIRAQLKQEVLAKTLGANPTYIKLLETIK